MQTEDGFVFNTRVVNAGNGGGYPGIYFRRQKRQICTNCIIPPVLRLFGLFLLKVSQKPK